MPILDIRQDTFEAVEFLDMLGEGRGLIGMLPSLVSLTVRDTHSSPAD